MNSTAHRAVSAPSLGLDIIGRIQSWILSQLKAHRERRANAEAIAYLQSLDSQLLSDIGVDRANVGHVNPSLLGSHPAAVVPDAISLSKRVRDR